VVGSPPSDLPAKPRSVPQQQDKLHCTWGSAHLGGPGRQLHLCYKQDGVGDRAPCP
jgi:hypothetical protein